MLSQCYKHIFDPGNVNAQSLSHTHTSLIKAVTMLNYITNMSLFQAVESGKSLSQMSLIQAVDIDKSKS